MNRLDNVNDKAASQASLERELLESFQGLLAGIPWLSDAKHEVRHEVQRGPRGVRWDAVHHLVSHDGRSVDLFVEAKAYLRPSQFTQLQNKWRHDNGSSNAVPVLGVLIASERIAELCRRSGWSWFDLAGNCYIDVPGLLHVERSGRKPAHRKPRANASLASAAAARLMRALLTPNHATHIWRQRALREQTCWKPTSSQPVSLGLVNKVIQHLVDQDFITSTESGVRLKDAVGLLKAWNKAYRFDRHERRSYFTLLKGQRLVEALGEVGFKSGNLAAYASFSAAERQAPHVSQAKTWIYVAAQWVDAVAHHAEAKEVDSGENLVVLVPADIGVMLSYSRADSGYAGERRLHCTDPVQTYIDLMHSGGRGEEAAQALLDRELLPAWKAAGVA